MRGGEYKGKRAPTSSPLGLGIRTGFFVKLVVIAFARTMNNDQVLLAFVDGCEEVNDEPCTGRS